MSDSSNRNSHPPSGKRLSSPDRVVGTILEGIAAGRFVPGQRLMEVDLTNELGVSRGPVREALKRLAAQRIITLTRHRGAHIRSLTHDEVDDLIKVLAILTGFAASLAARNINTDDNRTRFVRAYDGLMAHRSAADGVILMHRRDRFYGTLLRIGGNRELAQLLPATQVQLIRLQFQPYLMDSDRDRQFQEYESIGEAILEGDPVQADRAMQFHMNRTRKSILELPKRAFASFSADDLPA